MRPKPWLIPILLVLSSAMMALAWLGHLRFEHSWTFWTALGVSWALVLPEYALNTAATRWGHGTYSGAEMASIHLSGGVVCVAVVSNLLLAEPITMIQGVGYVTLVASIVLIFSSDSRESADGEVREGSRRAARETSSEAWGESEEGAR